MYIGKIDLPDEVLRAQEEGTLVVFAGAGVSKTPPSNYPNFEELSNMIAAGVATREDGEPIDRFLGRLEIQGVNVHRRAYEFLRDPSSKPNTLHYSLLSLFSSNDSIRLVTTNFDTHFTTAAAKTGDSLPEHYFAPALPLGDNFSGIIYLHGSVEKDCKRLVLTDSDFGRAYLTEGWATNFLKSLFGEYTVLFIGYSHDDPIMHYLSRGLTPRTSRFAFTDEDTEKWSFLNIVPIKYRNDNDHQELSDVIESWVQRSAIGAFGHERRIKEIVSSPPPLEPEEADYIKAALKDPIKFKFFARYAKSLDWLHWAEKNEAFLYLFKSTGEPESLDMEMAIADWFADRYILTHPNESIALVYRNGPIINCTLWYAIVYKLHSIKEMPEPDIFAKWIIFLIQQHNAWYRTDRLDYMLSKCRYPQDNMTAWMLIKYLTRPKVDLKPGYSGPENIMADIALVGDDHWLEKAWKDFFLPKLSDFLPGLEFAFADNLQQAHLYLSSISTGDSTWDKISLNRPAIENHEQNEHRRGINFLIEALRDILDYIAKNDSMRCLHIIESWYSTDIMIFKRLAINGMIEESRLTADEKVAWLLDKELLYAPGLKHELYRLLETVYVDSTTPLRNKLIAHIEQKAPAGDASDSKPFEMYNLLAWINKAAPDDTIVEKSFKAIQATHPDIRASAHPDFYSYMSSGWVGVCSPITADELLGKDPHDNKFLNWLLTYKGDIFNGPDRDGLLTTIIECITDSVDWGLELAEALKAEEHWKTDIWRSIFRGWQNSISEENNLVKVLPFLEEHIQLYSFEDNISDLLFQCVKENSEWLDNEQIAVIIKIAEKLWDLSATDIMEEDVVSKDWLAKAINHPGGKIAEIWLYALSKIRADAGEGWAGIPEGYTKFSDKILSGETLHANLGRVLLVSQLNFLFGIDSDWTREHILPLLSWTDRKQSQQAWHGFLFWGRPSEPLLDELRVLYKSSFDKLSSELVDVRALFNEHIAVISVYASKNPLSDGWLRTYIQAVDLEDRVSWAEDVGRQLNSLNEEAKKDLWLRWLKEYWEARIDGIPKALDSKEIRSMSEWSVYLGPVFDECVEMVCRKPAPIISKTTSYTSIYRDLKEKNYSSSHPTALIKLLLHLLPKTEGVSWFCDELKAIVEGLERAEVGDDDLKQLRNELARLGCLQDI